MATAQENGTLGGMSDGNSPDQATASQVLSGQDRIAAWQEELYKDVHRHPELGNQESQNGGHGSRALQEFGYEVHSEDRLDGSGRHPEERLMVPPC